MSRWSAMLAVCFAVAATPAPDAVTIVLKFVKRDAAAGAPVRFDPASCPACTVVTTPLFNADNPRETLVALTVPRRRTLQLGFDGRPDAVRRVVLEGGDVPFQAAGGRLLVMLPPVASDAVTAGEVATHIVEPGMVLRFEHADPARRAGAYAQGRFPAIERRAADVLAFAQREVIRRLGLGEWVERQGLGRIQVMGFDTNAPHGHVDAPPHVHMHLRWPQDTGTQIGHFYIGADGLLTHNIVGVKGLGAPNRRFGRGAAFTTIGPDGRAVYTHRITPEGWLELGGAGAAPCLIHPIGGGFHTGATILCPGRAPVTVAVEDDLLHHVLTVRTGPVTEVFRYDGDTGALLSPTAVAPPAPSVPRPLAARPEGARAIEPSTAASQGSPVWGEGNG